MDTFKNTSEIVEIQEELDPVLRSNNESVNKYSIEDDINRLFLAYDIKNSGRSSGQPRNARQKSALKRPIGVGSLKVSAIGVSEPVSLKQALRGLCISQAAEMAAMKRPSRPAQSLGVPEAVAIKRLYRAVVVGACGSGASLNEAKGKVIEVSIIPERTTSRFSDQVSESMKKSKSELVNGSDEISAPSHSSSAGSAKLSKPCRDIPSLIKPMFRAKNFVKKKAKLESTSFSVISSKIEANAENIEVPKSCEIEKQMNSCASTHDISLDSDSTMLSLSSNCRTRSREKGEFSQSSKSSLADYSSSPSISGQSMGSGSRPHMSKDLKWEAIHRAQNQHKILGLGNFKMLRKLGVGDIGTVYLAELIDTNCLFALKVMNKDLLSSRKKMLRAQTEKEILHMLDHPFLPTLYSHFETNKFMYLVIDYCRGGDLHVLRQKQPSRNFSERAVRFYGAEVLLALEYLHMLGVVYRDLKPENILIREDGHIMLTDFDLSLRCAAVDTKLLKSLSPVAGDENGCIHPFCLYPSWEVPCFAPKHRKIKSNPGGLWNPLPELVAEPTSARSNSFVGTHEYLAPEMVKGQSHGNAVDWWTYGVFLFELLYGKTPFKGSSNADTLTSIASQSLAFPDVPVVSFPARDLIRSLLIKEPEHRLGTAKGAAEIKQHPFFSGLNWALIRSTSPPE